MIIREAELKDIEKMHVVRMAVKENVLSNENLVTYEHYKQYLTILGKGWVAEIDEALAGFSIVDLKGNSIWALFVHPNYENRGAGTMLHNTMLTWYFNNIDKAVYLSTSSKTKAEHFYKKAGWKQIGFTKNGEVKFEMTKTTWINRNIKDNLSSSNSSL